MTGMLHTTAPKRSWSLKHARGDEQTPVAIPTDSQPTARCVVAGDQPIGDSLEVVEAGLLVLPATGVAPRLAVLTAAAWVGDCIDAAALQPNQHRRVEDGRRADVEPTVSIEQEWTSPIPPEVSTVDDEDRDARPIRRWGELLLSDIQRRVEAAQNACVLEQCPGPDVEPEHGARTQERLELHENLVRRTVELDVSDRARSGQLQRDTWIAFAREDGNPVVRVPDSNDGSDSVEPVGTINRVLLLRDDLDPSSLVRSIQVDPDHAAAPRSGIRVEVEPSTIVPQEIEAAAYASRRRAAKPPPLFRART